jgi:hypothetical protein
MCDDYQNFARASLLPAASLRVNQKSMMMVALSAVESHFRCLRHIRMSFT